MSLKVKNLVLKDAFCCDRTKLADRRLGAGRRIVESKVKATVIHLVLLFWMQFKGMDFDATVQSIHDSRPFEARGLPLCDKLKRFHFQLYYILACS